MIGNTFKDSENNDESELNDGAYFELSDWLNNDNSDAKFNERQYRKKRFLQQEDLSPIDTNFGLPDARTVALTLHNNNNKKNSDDNAHHLTVLMAFFTQFVFHDLAHVAQSVGHKGHRIRCCNLEDNDKHVIHPECWPILINNKKDPIFSQFNQNCMEYVRSSPTVRVGCTLGCREQINQVTSFLDASTVYGSSEEEAKSLRLFSDGLLRGQTISKNDKKKRNLDNFHQLLPAIETSQDCRSKNTTRCFTAGDIRVNSNLGLTLMHTLWFRRHNRVASELKQINADWTDEQLYQEARKIVGAELQHITYSELLPALLGEEAMNEFNLKPLESGFYYGYSIDLNPSISNALAVSVMPFIYTMLPEKLERYTQALQRNGVKRMSDTYFNPSELYNSEMFDEYIIGLMSNSARIPHLFYNNEMTNSVSKQMKEALDLISVIIQQGRDHGIPAYTEWRKSCKLKPVDDFSDLQGIMSNTVIQKLASIYSSVHDIDLFTGGLAERSVRGAAIGPVFTCLLARQFAYLKKSDRYYYENDLPPNSFSRDQLTEIRKSSLANLLCENGNKISFVQPQMTLVSDPYLNAFQYCKNLKKIDLTKWKSNEKDLDTRKLQLNRENVDQAIRNAFETLSNKKNTLNKHKIGFKSPQGNLHGFLRPTRQALEIGERASILELVSNNLISTLMESLKKDQENQQQIKNKLNKLIKLFPQQLDLLDYVERNSINTMSESSVSNQCNDDRFLPCDYTSPFRTASGWCNNVDNPNYGSSFSTFNRFLLPAYTDGISEPRKYSVTGNELPSGRIVSSVIHQDISNLHTRYALMLMQFGQFLDHDLVSFLFFISKIFKSLSISFIIKTFTPQSMGPNNSLLDCKPCDSETTVNSECWPIKIPVGDSFFPTNSSVPTCLHFVRSLPGQKVS